MSPAWIGRVTTAAILLGTFACAPRKRVVGFEAISTDGPLGADQSQSEVPSVGPETPFGTPVAVEGLLDPTIEIADPSLSADLLEIYFSSTKSGTRQIWMSTRAAVGQTWKAPTMVSELDTSEWDIEPWLSNDGLTLWLASGRAGGTNLGNEIYVSQRATRSDPWGVPSQLYLGTATTDRRPTVDVGGLNLVFYSERGSGQDLYQATRDTQQADWAAPVSLGEVNSSSDDADPALFKDGLGLVFSSDRASTGSNTELYESARPTRESPFVAPILRAELNSTANDGAPWLSNDGHYIIFTSLRSGTSRLYESWR